MILFYFFISVFILPNRGLNLGCSLLSVVLFVVQNNYHEDSLGRTVDT